jgi:hypothetical protein
MRTTRAGLVSLLSVLLLGGGAVRPPPATAAVVTLVGAGDIARCGSAGDEATARLLDRIGGTVFTTGDNAYPEGAPEDFADCYAPTWGRHLARTRPSPGNHEYHTPGAAGYFGYFDWRDGPGERGYYAYTRGDWRIYSLNSERIDDAQLAWLKADLARTSRACVLAYWHRPLFSSGKHGNDPDVRPFWRALYLAGAEVVVNGHDHDYERFALLRPGGSRSLKGLRQFVVGTGGAELRPFVDIQPHSVVRDASAHGVLRMVLRTSSYDWQFIAVDGSVRDSGSGRCHSRP